MPEGPGIQAVVAQQEVEDIAALLAGYELALRRVGSMPITQSIQGILKMHDRHGIPRQVAYADYTIYTGDSYIHDVLGAWAVGITSVLLDRRAITGEQRRLLTRTLAYRTVRAMGSV